MKQSQLDGLRYRANAIEANVDHLRGERGEEARSNNHFERAEKRVSSMMMMMMMMVVVST